MTKKEQVDEYADAIRTIITFHFLSDEELGKLLPLVEIYEAEEGESIVKEGEISPFFYGILAGTVAVDIDEATGKQVFVSALGPGDVFGEAGIFVSVKRTANVRALGPVFVMRIHRKDMIRFIKQNPTAGNKILMVIIHGLLRKLKMVSHELAYERKSDMEQADIDALIENIFSED
jgi:CRP/FNR family transcriptional regulator, cyclic AMP receptor protein